MRGHIKCYQKILDFTSRLFEKREIDFHLIENIEITKVITNHEIKFCQEEEGGSQLIT